MYGLTPSQIEQKSRAAGLDAPRVKLQQVEENIKHVEYVKYVSPSGQVLRWCVITAQNGHAVTGRPSAAVSPENDNEEIGQKRAFDNAFSELWALMGYALKEAHFHAAGKCESGSD